MATSGITAKRREHVAALCAEHGITWTVVKDQPASASPEAREITTPPVTMVRSYFVALHEVARCVLHHGEFGPPLRAGVAAWTWATSVAIEEPSPGVRRHIFRLLWAGLLDDVRADAAAAVPGREDPIWWMLGRLDDGPSLLFEAARIAALEADAARRPAGGGSSKGA